MSVFGLNKEDFLLSSHLLSVAQIFTVRAERWVWLSDWWQLCIPNVGGAFMS